MQVICEAYQLMKDCLGMSNQEIGEVSTNNTLKDFTIYHQISPVKIKYPF